MIINCKLTIKILFSCMNTEIMSKFAYKLNNNGSS